MDVDFVQYCPQCRAVEVVIEASSDPRKASDLARRFAKQLTATTLLLIHRYGDTTHEHPVTVSTWTPVGVKTRSKVEMSWSDFLTVMHDYHLEHMETECPKA
ncbi:MAG: hypothetical protein EKK42_20240 [Pseudonocardiaceae bacterium]|nr:MAG: hypothetical protein EKK42_20240 [Pseudonocardiaceae bacterium]